MKTIRQLLTERRVSPRGDGIVDTLKYIGKASGKFWNPLKTLMTATYAIAQPWVYTKTILADWLDLVKWASQYGRDLPDIAPELSLFIEQSESGPSTIRPRNKAILARLVDMNKRYLQLNTTPAKDAYNRVMAVTVLNTVRNPDKAADYMASAEMDLATLFREYLGGSRSEQPAPLMPPVASLSYNIGKAVYDYVRPTHATTVYNKYSVTEPHDITRRYEREDALPSSVVSRVPFPDAQTSGQYLPTYAKHEYERAPLHLYPRMKNAHVRRGPRAPAMKGIRRNIPPKSRARYIR